MPPEKEFDITRFNVRAYGLWLKDHKVLTSHEIVFGNPILKFPGGGVEFGEGIKDALRREWQEELALTIDIQEHFYTTDYFQPSGWDNSQVISVYYLVSVLDAGSKEFPYTNGVERFEWKTVDEQLIKKLTLPIDIVAGELLLKKLSHR